MLAMNDINHLALGGFVPETVSTVIVVDFFVLDAMVGSGFASDSCVYVLVEQGMLRHLSHSLTGSASLHWRYSLHAGLSSF